MSDVQPANLSPDRIRRLPNRAALAFAARNALRVLPIFNVPEDGGDQIRAAIACCLAALRTAIDPDLRYGTATTVAISTITREAGPTDAVTAARRALSSAAAAAVAFQDGHLDRLPDLVLSGYGTAGDAAEALGPRELFAMPADEDVSILESTSPEHVPLSFFQRPLFRTDVTPDRSPRVVGEWGKRLESLGLADIRDLYVRIHSGAISEEHLRTIDAWIHNYEASFSPAESAVPESAVPGSPVPNAPPEPMRPPDVWMLADQPLEGKAAIHQDKFDFKDYAAALATILDHPKTGTPFTMAINAPWGAGKTTLAKMLEHQLEQRAKDRGDTPHIICWFNAWMHDDAPNLASAFVAQVSRTAHAQRRLFRRLSNPLPFAVLDPRGRKRRGLLLGALLVGLTLVTAEHLRHIDTAKAVDARLAAVLPDSIDYVLAWFQSRVVVLGTFFTALAGLIGVFARVATSASLGGFVRAPDKAAEAGAIQSAQAHLRKLITQATWRGNRFIVFVDDIERCKPPRSIDVLDAINQLMDHKGVIVVLLGDMSTVAAAAQLRYKDLADILPSSGVTMTGSERGKEAFGRLYLQKIVQFQFDLPIPPRDKIQTYMNQLVAAPAVADGGTSGTVRS